MDIGNQPKEKCISDEEYVVCRVLEAQIPKIWMGQGISEKIEKFVLVNASLNARAFAKKLAVQMWGDRMMRYNKISGRDRKSKRANARKSMQKRDRVGFGIFKALITCWDAAVTMAVTRTECVNNKASDEGMRLTLDKMEKTLNGESEERADSLFKVANAYGLDTDDRLRRTKSSWYWEQIDGGSVPSPDWSIWDEIATQEPADLAADRARGVKEEDDEQSIVLNRIRGFQAKMARGEVVDRNLYDRFGVEVG